MSQGLPARGAEIGARPPLAFLCAGLVAAGAASAAAPDAQLARGEYVFHAAGCATCHTDAKHHGKPLAGGVALKTAFGVFYTPNITPDKTYGIGSWSDADFLRALREGVGPRGQQYYPAFPYTSYTHMSDADILALKAFLFTQPPIAQPNRPHALKWYARFRPLIRIWKWLYFRPGAYTPDAQRPELWNRGAYLVLGPSHCSECHTPRNALGGPRRRLFLAGTQNGPDGDAVPNITPDKKTGLGGWTASDIAEYLKSGMTPDGDLAGGLMADVVDHSTGHLTDLDREAIAQYLESVPPVQHSVKRERRKKPKEKKDEFGF